MPHALPSIDTVPNGPVRNFLEAVRLNLEELYGQRGDWRNSALLQGEGKQIGMLDKERGNLFYKAKATVEPMTRDDLD